jgi:hypothetical protein
MLRPYVKVLAVVLAAAASGITTACASASPSPSSPRHGTERFTVMWAALTNNASVIATGLFNDGGTVSSIYSYASNDYKLGAGSFRLTGSVKCHSFKARPGTCPKTYRAGGTYTLGHGTGNYARISGSGRFTTTLRNFFRRNAAGVCVPLRPLAIQGIVTFSGPATLRP